MPRPTGRLGPVGRARFYDRAVLPQQSTSPAPLSAFAMREAMAVCSGALGTFGLVAAGALSDSHPAAIVVPAVFMALVWGLWMWWGMRGRTR